MLFWIALIAVAVFVVGLIRPHWGVVMFAALLPLEALLPRNLVESNLIVTSTLAAAGGVMMMGSLLRLIANREIRPDTILGDPPKIIGLLFIFWILLTHPTDALALEGGRNWVFTFAQLWVLFLIAGVAFNTPQKHRHLMIGFAIACLVSATFAIAGGSIAGTREVRAAGFVSGPNAAARYFVVGMVFLFFVQSLATRTWLRVLTVLCAIYLLAGVLFTQSRSGIFLGLVTVVLAPLVVARQRAKRIILNIAAFVMAGAILLPSGAIDSVRLWFSPETVDPSADLESVNDNIRYYFWRAALEMWSESPITGVGMDNFVRNASHYVAFSVRNPDADMSTHNMYVSLLCETGLVGFGLFTCMIAACLRRVWRVYKDKSSPGLPAVWLVTLTVLLAGALLKNDIGEKLLWLALGVAGSFRPATPGSGDPGQAGVSFGAA
jgi:O-antigen ligase